MKIQSTEPHAHVGGPGGVTFIRIKIRGIRGKGWITTDE